MKTEERRTLYFETDADAIEHVVQNPNIEASRVSLLSLPRNSEADNRKFCEAILQGMTDGTIQVFPHRLAAVELQMKALGMLNKQGTSDTIQELKTVTDILESFGKGRNVLHNTTNRDPAEVERFLREKSGINLPKQEKHEKVRPRYKRSIKRGT